MKHTLKIGKEYFENLMSGAKTAEVRLNDRDYQLGDMLEFFDYETELYVKFIVTHIHSGLGLKENYVVLSVKKA